MKTPICALLSIVLLSGSPAVAQEPNSETSAEDPSTALSDPSQPIDELAGAEMDSYFPDYIADTPLRDRTFIPHSLEVLPFIPPPPPVVKRLPAVRVDAAVTRLSKNARTLTLQRGEPSTEPNRTCRRRHQQRPMSNRTNPRRRRSPNVSGNNAMISISEQPSMTTKSVSSIGPIKYPSFAMRPFAALTLVC